MAGGDWLAIPAGRATRALVIRLLNTRLVLLQQALAAQQARLDALKNRVTALHG